jgi:hypothetical protein
MKRGFKMKEKKTKILLWSQVFLSLSPRERLLLGKYETPEGEYYTRSHFSGIPMKHYELVMKRFPSRERRVKFQAKGKTVRKALAETFSVFYWPSFELYLGGGLIESWHPAVETMTSAEFEAAEESWEIYRIEMGWEPCSLTSYEMSPRGLIRIKTKAEEELLLAA